MSKPKRIQRRRTKGWRMPANTIVVDRSTWLGNPFRVGNTFLGGRTFNAAQCVTLYRRCLRTPRGQDYMPEWLDAGGRYVTLKALQNPRTNIWRILRGKNLACWCKPGEPCHADVLLELANA